MLGLSRPLKRFEIPVLTVSFGIFESSDCLSLAKLFWNLSAFCCAIIAEFWAGVLDGETHHL